MEFSYKPSCLSVGWSGVQEKNAFFTIHCNSSLAYIAIRDLQISQRNASVQPLLVAGNFFVQPIAAEFWRGRDGKLSRILEKNNPIFNEHPVSVRIAVSYQRSHGAFV